GPTRMKRAVRRFVRRRAGYRCEYCRLHESDQPLLSFHIEHIVAKKHHGSDRPDNLAWACLECNLGKSSNLSGRDTESGRVLVLFNPLNSSPASSLCVRRAGDTPPANNGTLLLITRAVPRVGVTPPGSRTRKRPTRCTRRPRREVQAG